MPRSPKRITIVEVAQHAGVSTKTVSRVLNGEPHVKEGLRERVRASVRALNYHPNVLAQGLARQRSHLLALVFENPAPGYTVELQMGVLNRLHGGRYRLVVIPVESVREHEHEVVGMLRSAAVDGVVLAPPASDSAVILDELDAIGLPYARIAPARVPEQGPSVAVDDRAAACEIARHVIREGHRRIAIVRGDPAHAASIARREGYGDALDEAGLSVPARWDVDGRFTYESGVDAGRLLLCADERPTAILAQNDDMAVGVLTAARECGLEVPRDLSLAGFDDSEISRITWPRITTVRQPVFDMAAHAADMLVARLDGEDGGAGGGLLRLEHHLIVRESVAPPAGE